VQVQQLLAEPVPVMMMMELLQVVMGCEMQAAALGNHELGFDEGNHIQYHTLNCNTYEILYCCMGNHSNFDIYYILNNLISQ
jgi:hypothetical protein